MSIAYNGEQIAVIVRERNEAQESATFWQKEYERDRAQRQQHVGDQEFRGNTVSYMYDKAKCYGDMVRGCSPALAAAGFPPEEFAKDGQVGAIARAVAAMAAEMDRLRADKARMDWLAARMDWLAARDATAVCHLFDTIYAHPDLRESIDASRKPSP